MSFLNLSYILVPYRKFPVRITIGNITSHIKEKAEMVRDKRTSDSHKALNKRVLPVLCQRFYNKGLKSIEIIRLTKDILNIIDDGGLYNAVILNKKLERLGWEKNIVDNYIFELLLYYLECEGTYKIEAYIKKTKYRRVIADGRIIQKNI